MRGLAIALLALQLAAPSDWVDGYVREQLTARHLPGASLAIVKDGRIVKKAGYGLASLELSAPATAETVYEIGSISKHFTAVAILLLVEDGRLSLDDPLSKYLQTIPSAWSAITLRHVLTHTAGLPDFDTGDIGFSYRREYTDQEFVDLLAARPLAFEPGTEWRYTNGFPLLGFVIERVSGMAYTDFVRTRIFEPLAMTSARFKTNGEVVSNRADGYLFGNGGYRHGEPLRPSVIAPNGGVMMNVVDFATFDIALTSGRLLSARSMDALSTPVRLTNGRTVSHGLGWFMDQFNGHRFGAHWGTTVTGHSAVIRRYVDDGVTVIMMANLDDGAFGIDAMSKRIADHYVPGVDLRGLEPTPADEGRLAAIRRTLAMIAQGEQDAGAVAGLASRIPAAVKARLAAALSGGAALVPLGGEQITSAHFTLNPDAVRQQWYRTQAADGTRYITVHLDSAGRMVAVLVEDA